MSVAGCRSTTVKSTPDWEIEQLARQRGVENLVIPYRLTDEMKAWVEEAVPVGIEPEERLRRLAEALLDGDDFELDYRKNYTGTAAEVFEARLANCLSFTHLFVGMARQLGEPVFFLEVRDIESYSKEGDLVVISDHIAVGFGPPNDMRIIDFALDAGTNYRRIRAISDVTAIALFYSNRGAEELRAGDLESSMSWLRDAVRFDPSLAAAWVNYGVALRRSGDAAAARRAYQQALEIDPATVSAYHNMAALLRLQGEEEEALELMELTDRSGNRNPYSYLALGDLNLRHGRLEAAERFYRKAIKLNDHRAETYAAMGLFELQAGDRERARRWLRKARKLDPEESELRVALLARRLDN